MLVAILVAAFLAATAGMVLAVVPRQSNSVDLAAQAHMRLDGEAASDEAGFRVASAGDVNGDGRADLIVGAPFAGHNGRSHSGSAYIVFGQARPRNIDLRALGRSGFRIDGAAAGDFVGSAFASAGDVNGDGRADLIVSAPGADSNGRPNSGSAYVVFGTPRPTNVDLLALGSAGFRIDGAAPNDAVLSVAGAGDLNGDGRADVIVGAFQAGNNGRPDSGSAYVIFGQAQPTNIDLLTLGQAGVRIDGAAAGDEAGSSVAGAGDVNGDGRADVMVGAPIAGRNGRQRSGSAYVIFSQAQPTNVDLLTLGQAGVRIDGAAAGDALGDSVAGAGDVNGDGRADMIMSALGASNNGRPDSGSAYVIFGQAQPTDLDLLTLGQAGFRIDGAFARDSAGLSVAGAGDVNGDGLADVIVGAPFADRDRRTNPGSASIVFGRRQAANIDLRALGSGGVRIDGAAAGDSAGWSVAGAGDVNRDGLADVIVGAYQARNNGGQSSGSAYVVLGRRTSTSRGGARPVPSLSALRVSCVAAKEAPSRPARDRPKPPCRIGLSFRLNRAAAVTIVFSPPEQRPLVIRRAARAGSNRILLPSKLSSRIIRTGFYDLRLFASADAVSTTALSRTIFVT